MQLIFYQTAEKLNPVPLIGNTAGLAIAFPGKIKPRPNLLKNRVPLPCKVPNFQFKFRVGKLQQYFQIGILLLIKSIRSSDERNGLSFFRNKFPVGKRWRRFLRPGKTSDER